VFRLDFRMERVEAEPESVWMDEGDCAAVRWSAMPL